VKGKLLALASLVCGLALVSLITSSTPAHAYIVLCPGWPVPCVTVIVCPPNTPQCNGNNQPCCLGSNYASPHTFSDLVAQLSHPTAATGEPDTLKATVRWCSPGGLAPASVTGAVAFLVNGVRDTVIMANSALSLSGTTVQTTATFANPGTYTITAMFSGDSTVAGSWSDPVTVVVGNVAVGEGPRDGFSLTAARPNPTGAGASLVLDLPTSAPIYAGVYDVAGRQVAVLANGILAAGSHELSWQGDVAHGMAPAGMYFVRVRGVGSELVRRVTVVR